MPQSTSPYSVLVTGASRGIGLGLVTELLKNEKIVKIFAGARNPEKATDLKAIEDPRLHVVKLDVQSDRSIRRVFEEIDHEVGEHGLTLLVNNAGIYSNYPIEEEPNRDALLKVLDTNVAGSLIVAQIFLPLLERAADFNKSQTVGVNRAALVQISSSSGSITNNQGPGDFHKIMYGATKTALNQITKTLGIDWARYGIFTVAVDPGWVRTDMGGPRGRYSVEESATAIVASLAKFSIEQTGGYFDLHGEAVPY